MYFMQLDETGTFNNGCYLALTFKMKINIFFRWMFYLGLKPEKNEMTHRHWKIAWALLFLNMLKLYNTSQQI